MHQKIRICRFHSIDLFVIERVVEYGASDISYINRKQQALEETPAVQYMIPNIFSTTYCCFSSLPRYIQISAAISAPMNGPTINTHT